MKEKLLIAFIIVIVLGSIIGITFLELQFSYGNEQIVTCTIKEKWIKRNEEKDMYLISCDDEVYKITDLLFKGKFNSSNIYASLEVGKKYKLKVTGYRFGYLSMYQNINSYELAE